MVDQIDEGFRNFITELIVKTQLPNWKSETKGFIEENRYWEIAYPDLFMSVEDVVKEADDSNDLLSVLDFQILLIDLADFIPDDEQKTRILSKSANTTIKKAINNK